MASVVKRNLIEIAEILLRAGARAFGKFTPRESSEPIRASKTTRSVKDDPNLEPLLNLMQSFAEGKNSDSGGLEVLELLVKVKASPRSLKSFCRVPRLETRRIWGKRKGEEKKRSHNSSPRCTHTDNEGDDDQECLFDFGRERSTTRIGGQQLHLHESPTKDNRRNKRKD